MKHRVPQGLTAGSGVFAADLLRRRERGRLGAPDEEDGPTNEQAMERGARLLSAGLIGAHRVRIMIDTDRSATMLLPEEF